MISNQTKILKTILYPIYFIANIVFSLKIKILKTPPSFYDYLKKKNSHNQAKWIRGY